LGSLPDPRDRHVLAAAIHCHADEIVTFNVRDFPDAVLKPYCIGAVHPDAFIERLLNWNPAVICSAVRAVRRRLVNPTRSAEEMLVNYERLGLVKTARMLRTQREAL
jgi:hypothetical protein